LMVEGESQHFILDLCQHTTGTSVETAAKIGPSSSSTKNQYHQTQRFPKCSVTNRIFVVHSLKILFHEVIANRIVVCNKCFQHISIIPVQLISII